jgi:hypothetical protein
MMVQSGIAPALAMTVQQRDAPAAAMVVQENVAPAPAIVVKNRTTTAPEPLHIDKPKEKAYLGTSNDDERIEGWYLDTSARREHSQVSSRGEDRSVPSRHGAQRASTSAPPSPPSAPAASVAGPDNSRICHATSK